jgi:NADPH:quinone reductase-like Zn-dependent oxidoreductase
MKTMKAIICSRYGSPEVLQIKELKKPIPREDEVLVKIFATSVTDSDIFIRSSRVAPELIIPFRLMIGIQRPRNPIIGEVFAGKIEYSGSEIKRFKVGDQVLGFTGFSLGAYADYKCMKEKDSRRGCLSIKPKNITFEDATSVAYGGLLALQFMDKVQINEDSKVLIYGASSTSGTFAIQYAKNFGAEVTAVCSSPNFEFVKSLGADKVIDYTKNESIKLLEKYDLILDAVGKRKTSELKKNCPKSLTQNGKYISIDDEALQLNSERLNKITKLVESGKIKPVTDRIYTFDQIVEAHKYVELGHKRGNVAITVGYDHNTKFLSNSVHRIV